MPSYPYANQQTVKNPFEPTVLWDNTTAQNSAATTRNPPVAANNYRTNAAVSNLITNWTQPQQQANTPTNTQATRQSQPLNLQTTPQQYGSSYDPGANGGNQQVLQTAQGAAIKGMNAPQTTLDLTSQKTQDLLKNPSGTWNADQNKNLQMDQYNRQAAGQLEALRQQAPATASGQNLGDLIGASLQVNQGRSDLSRQIDLDAAKKQQDDLLAALGEGRNTATTESQINAQGIQNLVNVRGAAEGEENRKAQQAENAIDRGIQVMTQANDIEGQRYLTELKSTLEGLNAEDQRNYLRSESSLDRQLQREVEAGRLSMQDAELAQNASQFADEQAFNTWATQSGYDNDAINRAWQSSEQALDRSAQVEMAYLENEFAQKGVQLNAVIDSLQYMDGTQARGVIEKMAYDLGIEIPRMTAEQTQATDVQAVTDKLTSGEKLTGKDYQTLVSNQDFMNSVPDVSQLPDLSPQWTTAGKNRWTFRPETAAWLQDNVGTVIQSDGRLYRIASVYNPENNWQDRGKKPAVVLEDVQTGTTQTIGGGSGEPTDWLGGVGAALKSIGTGGISAAVDTVKGIQQRS